MLEQDRIIKINIEEEMKSSYIDYSMSVIVSRALPDVRDGFKPVHRRILYGMMELGNTSDKPYKKSARIVGEVLGKYHPHGDSSVYFAMVRMAQEWAMRYPLVDGQGNFGSVDGDSPAAMRYTEARLNKLGEAMMDDLYKETVDFEPNFDNTLVEPKVMPTRIPNLLVNGASGIAVGMATNMPPHNLSEVIEACEAYIDNPEITVEELMEFVKAPDFPTGGFIYGVSGVREAYLTGRGRVIMRAKAEIESGQTHDKIVITEIPYNVNKAELIKYIADLVNDKKIEGISNANDESDRDGMRIVIDIKRDANASVVLNKLYKMTALQTSFGVNNVALVHGRPKTLNLRDLIKYFIEHRHEVVIRRTQFDLRKAKERAHILEGLIIASDNIDEVIRIIRAAKTPNDAIAGLIERFNLTEIQSRAIVEMRLRQLTGLMQDQLHAEYEEIMKQIAYLESILADDEVCRQVMKDELLEVKTKYGDERRSEIVYSSEEFNPEDFYADDQMIITISHMGYIKRTPLTEFRAQNRGGVGSKGTETRDEDFVEHIYPATMHNTMMFFTQKGKCYWLKVYEIPEGTKNSKGRAIQNLLNIDSDDNVTAYLRVKSLEDSEFINSHYVLFCTKKGVIKKTLLEQYSRPRQNGVNAITIREDDSVIEVRMTNGNNEIIIANRNGRAIRFHEAAVRVMGRTATGVRGITLDNDGQDEVVGMICIKDLE
ncbi:DNA gyrase subunit A, partial [Bacteroides xylanisolvens]